MAEAKWKQLLGKPSGALPENVVQKVVLPLAAVLVVVVYLTSRGGGPEEAALVDPASEAVDQNAIEGFLASMRRDQDQASRERQIAADRAAAEAEAARAQAALAALGARTGTRPEVFGSGGRAGMPGAEEAAAVQTQGEVELAETLRLEALERRTRSLRAPSLVQTFRDPEERRTAAAAPQAQPWLNAGEAAGGQQPSAANTPESAPPAPGLALADPASVAAQMEQAAQMQQAMNEALLGGAPNSTLREPQARTVPGVTGPEAAETPEPAVVTVPADPPGTERVYEGSMLSGVLVNQLDGDFAGPVLAQVAIPFYSRDRQRILVPRGTRLLGTAQAVGDQDQSRLAVGFHRMVWPDGRWVDLSFHGLNQIGESALIDQVNRHYWSMFAAAGAVGVLAGFTLQGSSPLEGGMAGFRSGAGQGFGQSATQILQRFLNRMPTITIRAGHRLRVWVTSDFLVPRPAPHPERMYR